MAFRRRYIRFKGMFKLAQELARRSKRANRDRLRAEFGVHGALQPVRPFTSAIKRAMAVGQKTGRESGEMLQEMVINRNATSIVRTPQFYHIRIEAIDGFNPAARRLEIFERGRNQLVTPKMSRFLKVLGARAGVFDPAVEFLPLRFPPFRPGTRLQQVPRETVAWEPAELDRFSDKVTDYVLREFGFR